MLSRLTLLKPYLQPVICHIPILHVLYTFLENYIPHWMRNTQHLCSLYDSFSRDILTPNVLMNPLMHSELSARSITLLTQLLTLLYHIFLLMWHIFLLDEQGSLSMDLYTTPYLPCIPFVELYSTPLKPYACEDDVQCTPSIICQYVLYSY